MLYVAGMNIVAEGTSFWSLVVSSVKASSPIENSILLLLVACSIISWAMVIWKLRSLAAAKHGAEQFLAVFEKADYAADVNAALPKLPRSPHAAIYAAAMGAIDKARQVVAKAPTEVGTLPINAGRTAEQRAMMEMDHACRDAFTRMHRGLDILASIASATPFIGLFGTVLGIMSTFQVLGSAKSASLNVVAPGIAAALIATAAGLAVAIPAVFLYNWLMARMDEQQEQAEMFIEQMEQWLGSADAYEHKADDPPHAPHHEAATRASAVRVG